MISHLFLIISISLILIVIRITNLGTFFRSINTLVHEEAHAFMGLLCGGSVGEIKLNDNSSGSCSTKTKGKFKSFLVSCAGYITSALFAWLLFYSYNKGWRGYVFYYFLIVSVIGLIFWIRNTYGILWTLFFAGLNLAIALFPKARIEWAGYIIVIYALLIMIDNLIACFTLCYLAILNHKKAGDATNLEKITHLPALIWALLFTAAACFSAYECYLLIW